MKGKAIYLTDLEMFRIIKALENYDIDRGVDSNKEIKAHTNAYNKINNEWSNKEETNKKEM